MLLACGHLCQGFAGFKWDETGHYRECLTCGTWERYIEAPDLDLTAVDDQEES